MKEGLQAFIKILPFLILSELISPFALKLSPQHPFLWEILLLVILILLFYVFIIKIAPLIWKDERKRMNYLLKYQKKRLASSGLFFLIFFILFWSATHIGQRLMPAHPFTAEMGLKLILLVCGAILGYFFNKAIWKEWKLSQEKFSK